MKKENPFDRPAFIVVSTTEARQKLHKHLQDVQGDKTFTVYERYGRPLGALACEEAVKMLAGEPVDEDVRRRIQRNAQAVMAHYGF